MSGFLLRRRSVNLEVMLIHRSILGIIDQTAVHEAEDNLAAEFLSFRCVVNDLKDRIDVSIAVAAIMQFEKHKGKSQNSKARKNLRIFGNRITTDKASATKSCRRSTSSSSERRPIS